MRGKISLFAYMWTAGAAGGIVFTLFRLTGRIRIQGYRKDKLNPQNQGMIVICNHPSPAEPLFLPFLFFPRFLFSRRSIPYSLPAGEYYHTWWFAPCRKLSISIERNSRRGALKSSQEVEKLNAACLGSL